DQTTVSGRLAAVSFTNCGERTDFPSTHEFILRPAPAPWRRVGRRRSRARGTFDVARGLWGVGASMLVFRCRPRQRTPTIDAHDSPTIHARRSLRERERLRPTPRNGGAGRKVNPCVRLAADERG